MEGSTSDAPRGIYACSQQLIDWRHVVRRLQTVDSLQSLFELPGRRQSDRAGNSTEFREIRHWQPGDNPRSIDWRVSARRADLMVRQYQDTRECPLYLIVDQRARMFFGSTDRFKSVTALDIAAILSWLAHTDDDRVGGQVFGVEPAQWRCSKGKQRLLQWLQQLVQSNLQLDAGCRDANDIDAGIRTAIAAAPVGARVAFISDFGQRSPHTLGLLSQLAATTRLALFAVSDPLERALSLRGRLGVSNGRQKTSIWFDRSLRRQLRQASEASDVQLNQWCEDSGVRLHRLSTADRADEGIITARQGRTG
jgi:uncharacterized protein (DUF58 family)